MRENNAGNERYVRNYISAVKCYFICDTTPDY